MGELITVSGCGQKEFSFGLMRFSTADFMFSGLRFASSDVASPITLPGYGYRDLDELTDVVLGQVKRRAKPREKVDLACHSAGGPIGARLQAEYPDLIGKVFAIASPFRGELMDMDDLFHHMQGVNGIDLPAFDESLQPFLDKTLQIHNSVPSLAGRLIMFGAQHDEIVQLPSSLDSRQNGARRFEAGTPGWPIVPMALPNYPGIVHWPVVHMTLPNHPGIVTKILDIHYGTEKVAPEPWAA